jgi:hypothetical protein
MNETRKRYEGELALIKRDLDIMDQGQPGRTHRDPKSVVRACDKVMRVGQRLGNDAMIKTAKAYRKRALDMKWPGGKSVAAS